MGDQDNILEVANLQPDYLGFIFYEKSSRNFKGCIPAISNDIIKTGIFVNASIDFVHDKIIQFKLRAIQLHGDESPSYCKEVKALGVEVFKVFSIKGDFDFQQLVAYEQYVDFFLFDTKGKQPGGNGFVFDWNILRGYSSKTPFILSGGIGMEELSSVRELMNSNLPIYALDLNSKFEIKPAEKDASMLKEFLNKIEEPFA